MQVSDVSRDDVVDESVDESGTDRLGGLVINGEATPLEVYRLLLTVSAIHGITIGGIEELPVGDAEKTPQIFLLDREARGRGTDNEFSE